MFSRIAVGRRLVARTLFRERHQIEDPTTGLLFTEATVGVADPPPAPAAGREVPRHLMMVDRRQRELLEIVLSTASAARIRGPLGSRATTALSGCR